MKKKFKELLEREEKKKIKLIDKSFYYSYGYLENKIKEEEQLNLFLKDKKLK